MRQATLNKLEGDLELPLDFDRMPTQRQFIADNTIPFRAYGGGYANGKTSGGCALAILYSVFIPGNRGFIGRYDGKELRQTTLSEFKAICPPQLLDKQNDQMGYIKFKNQYGGSEILYGDLKENLVGPNLGWFWFDQAEEVEESRWHHFVGRLRKQTVLNGEDGHPLTHPDGRTVYAPRYGLATFNPKGKNHWLYKLFHPDSPTHAPDYRLYMASTFDGRDAGFVDQAYIDRMLAVFPDYAVKRYLEGAWDIFEDRIYPMFAEETHVLPTVKLHPSWEFYESIDHGMRNPTAVQWWGIDPAGTLYLLDEHYEANRTVEYHANIIKAKRASFGRTPNVTFLDSHCWAKDQSRGQYWYSIADEYREHGIYAVPGQKDTQAGINRISEVLANDPLYPHPVTQRLGAPHLYVSDHCRHFISEMLGYTWKRARGTVTRNQPDEPSDYNNHHMDALSYFLLSRPQRPTLVKETHIDVLDLYRKRVQTYNPLSEPAAVGGGSWMGY